MIVYGDPEVRTSAAQWLADLRNRSASRSVSLDNLRALLIRTGQFEQALTDEKVEDEGFAIRITNAAANAFYAAYAETDKALPLPPLCTGDALDQLRQFLEREFPDRSLTLKIPEGYAFYALYPEQYCQAARLWNDEHHRVTRRNVLVVGIRSIGTSLSAVVTATLAAHGWQASRLTIRPQGHPFDRVANVPITAESKAACVIIVDEGPGLSGSSMKAVADGLQRTGFPLENISLLPGHNGEPGGAATPEIRAWWQRAQRYCVPSLGARTAEPARIPNSETRGLGHPHSEPAAVHSRNARPVLKVEASGNGGSNARMISGNAHFELRWNGSSLAEALADRAARIYAGESFEPCIDLGAGRWRELLFANEKDWPAVATSFERAKFLCRSRTRSILWKYIGLDAAEGDVLRQSSFMPWLPKPLATFCGFAALPWIEGEPLNRVAINEPSMIRQMGRHVVALSQSPLSDEDHRVAVARLGEMLYWNVKENLNDQLADLTKLWANVAAECPPSRTYGDGHLAPHEWICDSNGKVWKTDYFGHTQDHTVVGRQSILWDVASALIEWDLDSSAAITFLELLNEGGSEIDLRPLEFYCAAFAAFRLGLYSIATPDDAAEQRRVATTKDYYRAKLKEILVQGADYLQLIPRTRTDQASSSRMLTAAGLTSRR